MNRTPPSRLSSFLAELRERRVIQVAVVYAVVAFGVAQVADIVAPGLNLPEWTVSFVLFLLILGFPVAVALAWVFDVTPQGVRRTSSHPRKKPSPGRGSAGEPEARRFDSIAVLPMANLCPEKDQEYFSDGLTEELLNVLARVPGLRVPARTSSFAFKGQNTDIREIGEKLDVETVLEGSVRKWESQLVITAQLIEVQSGYHLWSDTYDRRLEDVFAIQREIARSIVETLRGSHLAGAPLPSAAVSHAGLRAAEPASMILSSAKETRDTEVYQLYLKGRYFWNQRTREGLEKARAAFEEAIRRAPTYAPAYAGLADTYFIQAHYGLLSAREAIPLAREAAERAVALEERLEEAQLSLAAVRLMEYRWTEAGRAFRRALELNPGSARAHHWYANLPIFTGRLEEALAELRRAAELDPLSLPVRMGLSTVLFFSRRYEEAIREGERALELVPEHPGVLGNLSMALSAAGRHEEAIAAAERAARADTRKLGSLGAGYAYAGRREEALRVLGELEARAREQHVPRASFADIHLALGDHERALELLERALEEGDPNLAQIASDPSCDPLRDHPRFRALLARMNLG